MNTRTNLKAGGKITIGSGDVMLRDTESGDTVGSGTDTTDTSAGSGTTTGS